METTDAKSATQRMAYVSLADVRRRGLCPRRQRELRRMLSQPLVPPAAGRRAHRQAPFRRRGQRVSRSTRRRASPVRRSIVSGTGWPVGQHVLISVENLIDEQGGVNGTGWLSDATVNVYGGFATSAFSFPYAVCGVRPKAGTIASIVAATDDNSVRVAQASSPSHRRRHWQSCRHSSSPRYCSGLVASPLWEATGLPAQLSRSWLRISI